jgi:flagellin
MGGQIASVAAKQIASGQSDTFTFYTGATTGTNAAVAITITGKATALDSVTNQINELNAALKQNGLSIYASLNQQGQLQFQSASAFSVTGSTTDTANANLVNSTATAAAPEAANNTGLYNISYTGVAGAGGSDIQITVGNTNVQATLATLAPGTAVATQANVDAINAALKQAGVTSVSAVIDQTTATPGIGTISFQGTTAFSIADDSAVSGVFTTAANTGAATAGKVSANPQVAIDAITSALASLGQTQGKIGAGENTLNYAINLAQSQITNYSSAESQIRDANVAQEAANLTKAQVLQQTSIAAMAQANAEPQALLKLFQ